MDRTNENIITSHKSNLSILRLRKRMDSKAFSGTSNLEWAFSSSVYIHGRSSFVRYFWPRIVIRSGAFGFIFTPYPFSTLFSFADITGAVLCLIFPAVARSSSRFFALGSFAPRKRAALLLCRRYGRTRRRKKNVESARHRSSLSLSLSTRDISSPRRRLSIGGGAAGIYDFRIG